MKQECDASFKPSLCICSSHFITEAPSLVVKLQVWEWFLFCPYYISLTSFSRCSWQALLLRPCLFMNINGKYNTKRIYVARFTKRGFYIRTVSRHNFHHHLITISMDQQHVWLILLKVEQSVSLRHLSQACLMSMNAWVAFKWPQLPLTSRQPSLLSKGSF